MGVCELQESQKMLVRLNLCEGSSNFNGSEGSTLLVGDSDDKIDLWSAKIEVYEVIRPHKGNTYRMRCLHHTDNSEEVKGGEISLPLTILVPHYEVTFFEERQF